MKTVHRTGIEAVVAILLLLVAGAVAAQDARVEYVDGFPELRKAQGGTDFIDFGMELQSGDSVVTGRDDFVELSQGADSSIRVEPDTVFTIREVETSTGRQTVMSNSVGSVSYRFGRLAGREPRIGTTTVVAGVRGTEVTVYAGADGSAMFLVDSGEVEVTSAGESVSLTEAQGVEVPAGGPPGEVFEIIGRAIDFSTWSGEKQEEFLADPVGSLRGLEAQLQNYYGELIVLQSLYTEKRAEYDAAYADLEDAVERFGRESDEAEMIREVVGPLGQEATVLAFNIRYYALTSLSLRRYLIGQMSVEMKTRYILDRENPAYTEFVALRDSILEEYESRITQHLVAVDI